MIIYEKENKLNINFDNSTEAEPDVVISKENGQVNIEAGGQPIGGGAEPFVVTFSGTSSGGDAACDKTFAEILEAKSAGREIKAKYVNEADETCADLSVCWTHGLVQFAYSCFHDTGDGTFAPVTLVYCEYSEYDEAQIDIYFD